MVMLWGAKIYIKEELVKEVNIYVEKMGKKKFILVG